MRDLGYVPCPSVRNCTKSVACTTLVFDQIVSRDYSLQTLELYELLVVLDLWCRHGVAERIPCARFGAMTIRRRRVQREVNARRSTLAQIIILPPSICRPLNAFAVMYTRSKKEVVKGPRLHRLARTPCEGLVRLRHHHATTKLYKSRSRESCFVRGSR